MNLRTLMSVQKIVWGDIEYGEGSYLVFLAAAVQHASLHPQDNASRQRESSFDRTNSGSLVSPTSQPRDLPLHMTKCGGPYITCQTAISGALPCDCPSGYGAQRQASDRPSEHRSVQLKRTSSCDVSNRSSGTLESSTVLSCIWNRA